MRKLLFAVSLTFLSALFLSSNASSEENFTISVDPGWMDMKEKNCKTITENTENGTYEYEECDYYLEYETELTNDDIYWSIGGNGESPKIRFSSYWPLGGGDFTDSSPNSTFVFTLKGTNFSKDIEYTFSYWVTSYSGNKSGDISNIMESQYYMANSQITFFGNDSIEVNLSGTFDSYLNETTLHWRDNCAPINAMVRLEGYNDSTGAFTSLASYSSSGFYLDDASNEKCRAVYYIGDAGFNQGSLLLYLGLFLLIVLVPLSTAYAQIKVVEWQLTGRYKNAVHFPLFCLTLVLVWVALVIFFPPICCLGVLIFSAQLLAYYTGHYDKPEILSDSEEGDSIDTKKSVWPIILLGLVLFFLLLMFMSAILYTWSDIRLKRNIVLRGQSNSGLNIYEYNYIWSNKKYRGVMAQELLSSSPEAVSKLLGYYAVNYNKIDVDFERI